MNEEPQMETDNHSLSGVEGKSVPKLRFPEFRGKGMWDEKQLIDVCNMQAGKFVRAADINEKKKTDMYSCYGGNGLRGFTSTFTHTGKYSLIGRQGALCGNITLATGKFHATEHAVVTVPKEGVDTDWLFYKLVHLNLNQYATGQAQPGLSVDNLGRVEVEISREEKEQQKIADCLSSLDKLITLQTQKRDALKAYKKGLMQQLFPAEGETQPKLRFPEFRGDGGWEEKLFGEILKVNSGKGFKASEYSDAGIRLLQIENVGYSVTKWGENTIYLPEKYAFEYPELVLQKGDIVLALNRPVTNNELKIARIQKDDEPLILYQRVGKLVLLNNSLNENFVFQICQKFIKDFVINKSIGSDQPFISLRDLYAQLIRIPKPEEQQKIADCLSSLGALITAQTQKIEALKSHKKGLMQQLFPSMDDGAAQDAKAEVGA